MISLDEALGLITHAKITPRIETRSLDRAMGCTLAEDLLADRDYPPFHRAMMDGFALSRAFLIAHPDHAFPVVGRVLAGEPAPDGIPQGTALRIMTGAPVPPSLDLIIPLENAVVLPARAGAGVKGASPDAPTVSFPGVREKPPKAFANIAHQGEDCPAGSTLLQKGSPITPATIGAIAAIGQRNVRVLTPPRVGVITTGSELVDITTPPLPHQIRDTNGWVLLSFLHALGINPATRLCVTDTRAAVAEAVSELIDCDLLILTGAVSAGDTDFVPDVLAAAGVTEVFHGVSIKPGKPIWFGQGPSGPVFGLPGNPFAVQCGFRIFVMPVIHRFLGVASQPLELPLTATRKLSGSRSEFFPVSLARTTGGTGATPLSHHGSGDVLAAAHSDGIALHDPTRPLLQPGDPVSFFPWSPIVVKRREAGHED